MHHTLDVRAVRESQGFSLLEALVAAALLAVGIGSLAQLVMAASRTQRVAGEITLAALLAADRVEAIASLITPPVGGAVERNVDGFCEKFDAGGRLLGACTGSGTGAAFTCRWSITAPADVPGLLLVHVRVVPGAHHETPPGERAPGEVKLVTLVPRRGV